MRVLTRRLYFPAAFFAGYGALLLLLLEVKPLWLDEILQLAGMRAMTFEDSLRHAAVTPGGVPLALLGQVLLIKLMGYSVFSARLLSALCGVGSVLGVWRTAQMLGMKHGLLAAAVFAMLPLEFRYAMEARPYAAGMLWSVWGTVALLWMLRDLRWWRAAVYGGCIALALYSHPYTVFVALGHLTWAFWCQGRGPYLRSLVFLLAAIGGALVLYGAWFWWTEALQRRELAVQGLAFGGIRDAIRVTARELSGAGFFGTALLVAGFAGALFSRRLTVEAKVFFGCAVVAPLCGAVVMDSAYGYFYAIRQVMFLLPGLVLAAAAGAGRGWCVVMLGVAIAGDVGLVARQGENWQAATELLVRTAPAGGCVLVVPSQQAQLYEFFSPDLRTRWCGARPQGVREVAVVVTPYTRWGELEGVVEGILACAFYKTSETAAGGTRILLFARDQASEGFCVSEGSENFSSPLTRKRTSRKARG